MRLVTFLAIVTFAAASPLHGAPSWGDPFAACDPAPWQVSKSPAVKKAPAVSADPWFVTIFYPELSAPYLAMGMWVAVWQEDTGGSYDIKVQRFINGQYVYDPWLDPAGEQTRDLFMGEPQTVNQFISGNQEEPAVAVDTAGDAFVVVWTDLSGVAPSIKARFFE